MFSTGAFFASLIEPIIYRRTIIWYEILFGFIVIIGIFIITQSEIKYLTGILLGISSAFFSSLFAVLNGKFLKQHTATVISFYEFLSGVLFHFYLYFIFWRWIFFRFFQFIYIRFWISFYIGLYLYSLCFYCISLCYETY